MLYKVIISKSLAKYLDVVFEASKLIGVTRYGKFCISDYMFNFISCW